MVFNRIFVLTGAGISAESGIPVFRSETGLWENHNVNDVATYAGFKRDKTLVHNFYNTMRQSLKTKEPNAGHLALTKLQEGLAAKGGLVTIVTQNIDDLHEKAHSKNVIHMHGRLNTLLCESCHERIDFFDDSSVDTVCPKCGQKTMRPDIVWFGEMPYDMEAIEKALLTSDLFMAIGTSGVVYPAAGYVSIARRFHKPCLEFNLEPSAVQSKFTNGFYGKASETLPKFVDYILEHDAIPSQD